MKKLKQIIKNLISFYRRLTWKKRGLPDFIIVGAQKAGTTSLFDYLSKHPQILPPNKKEVHFFDGGLEPSIDTYKKGEKWYRSHFPFKFTLKNSKTFEASPLYLFNPLAPERIKRLLPKVKIIILLRNPVDRAISQYHHENKKNKWDSLPILEAMKREEMRLKPFIENKDFKSREFIKYSYKSRGLYKEQIERYFSIFPQENILLIESEKLFNNPNEVLQEVLRFVGVDQNFEFKDLLPKNTGKYNQNKIDHEVKSYLKNYFIEPNKELYKFLGRDFNW